MNSKQQGGIGLAKAIYIYSRMGYSIFTPLTDNERFDFIAYKNGIAKRIEVKTANCRNDEITLRTKGGNKSGTGKEKRISDKECDEVFVLNLRDDEWKIYSSSFLQGRRGIKPWSEKTRQEFLHCSKSYTH